MASLTVFRAALISYAPATAVTGTLAVTDRQDTLAAAGSPVVVGTLAVTDGTDALASSGSPTVTGTLAVTDGADTLTATGGQTPSGSLAVTDRPDTLAATGTPVIVGSLSVTDGRDTLVGGDAAVDTSRQPFVWREYRNFISHRDGGATLNRLEYSQHAEDPQPGVWWNNRAGTLIDFTGYTFTLKIHDSTTTVLTKTTGITGAAGSGSPPTGTPNIAIQWAVDELLNIPAGEYTMELTPRTGGRDRDPITAPIRIRASAP